MQEKEMIKIQKFLAEYDSSFSDQEKECLLGELAYIQEGARPSILACEILDYLNLLPDEWNIYEGFVKLLQKNFDLNNRRIVEVAGGILPRLGIRISELVGKEGHIVVYDPRLSKKVASTSKMLLKKNKFIGNFDDSRDLIIGLLPCEATPYIIDAIEEYGLDFMFTLSDGLSSKDIDADGYSGLADWLLTMTNRTEEAVKTKNLGKLCYGSLEEYGLPEEYKVLYNRR